MDIPAAKKVRFETRAKEKVDPTDLRKMERKRKQVNKRSEKLGGKLSDMLEKGLQGL